jgi:hypothetical protein
MMMMMMIIMCNIFTITGNKNSDSVRIQSCDNLHESSTLTSHICTTTLDYKFTLSKYNINKTRFCEIEACEIEKLAF